jgi:hypothetical protein
VADNPDMLKSLLSLGAAIALLWQATAPIPPDKFRTTARFSVDATQLPLTTVVATVEPHRTVQGDSWLHVYFYAFPFTPDDVSSVMNGKVDQLDRRQLLTARTASERNSSRAVLHLLVERDSTVSNVSLELPGVTCTIAETAEKMKAAFPDYRYDGKSVALRGQGRFECDLSSVGMGKRQLTWNVDVNVPVFAVK